MTFGERKAKEILAMSPRDHELEAARLQAESTNDMTAAGFQLRHQAIQDELLWAITKRLADQK